MILRLTNQLLAKTTECLAVYLDFQELNDQVDETLQLLKKVKDYEEELREATEGEVRGAVNMVDVWIREVEQFKEKVFGWPGAWRFRVTNFNEWNNMI